jgi:hypothetical protein
MANPGLPATEASCARAELWTGATVALDSACGSGSGAWMSAGSTASSSAAWRGIRWDSRHPWLGAGSPLFVPPDELAGRSDNASGRCRGPSTSRRGPLGAAYGARSARPTGQRSRSFCRAGSALRRGPPGGGRPREEPAHLPQMIVMRGLDAGTVRPRRIALARRHPELTAVERRGGSSEVEDPRPPLGPDLLRRATRARAKNEVATGTQRTRRRPRRA